MTNDAFIVGRSVGLDIMWLEEPVMIADTVIAAWSPDVDDAWELDGEIAAIGVAWWARGSIVERA